MKLFFHPLHPKIICSVIVTSMMGIYKFYSEYLKMPDDFAITVRQDDLQEDGKPKEGESTAIEP
jgi:hypothetical protein